MRGRQLSLVLASMFSILAISSSTAFIVPSSSMMSSPSWSSTSTRPAAGGINETSTKYTMKSTFRSSTKSPSTTYTARMNLVDLDSSPPDEPPSVRSCPSYCDDDGVLYGRTSCTVLLPFCCKQLGDGRLLRLCCCAANDTDRLDLDVGDRFNCDARGWLTVLGVCVPIGTVCFLGVIVLCIYQHRLKIRRRLRTTRCCACIPSTVDDDRVSTRRPSVCSTTSYSSSIRSRRADPDDIQCSNPQQSLHDIQPHPPEICRPIYDALYSTTNDDVSAFLRLGNFHVVAATSGDENDLGTSDPVVYVVQLDPPLPPPYDDRQELRPPDYAELFPQSYPT